MLYLSRDASAQVLVDPSCSGSGMRHEHSSVIEESNVRELVELQTSVLKHALSFPQALRVVYRCSMFQPNEAMQWPLMLVYLQHLLSLRGRERRRRRGGRDYAADEDFYGGFFVALFERNGIEKPQARTRSRKLPVQALRSFYGSSLLGISK